MADFNEVHRDAMRPGSGRLRLGEPWRVAIREPLEFAELGPVAVDARVTVVTFIASEGGRLKPASQDDAAIIADWKNRHRDTPPDWFGLPDALNQY